VQVLTVLLQRLEKPADTLEAVRLPGYDGAIYKLRNFAKMVRAARDYLAKRSTTS
jgi:hypothetical protein